MSAQITVPLEVVGNLVRTSLPHGGVLVAECFDPDSGQPHTDTSKAYARLFAGARDLLQALKEADTDFDREGFAPDSPYREHIRAAIAKAEGHS